MTTGGQRNWGQYVPEGLTEITTILRDEEGGFSSFLYKN